MKDLIQEELNMMDQLDWDDPKYIRDSFDPNKNLTYDPDQDFYDTEENSFGDLQTPSHLPDKSNRNHYTKEFGETIVNRIIEKMRSHYGKRVEHRGTYSYHPGGRCGWHTNSNAPGKRIYLTWAEEDNKSFFKYFDNEMKQIVTKYDKKGWHVNEFIISDEDLLWHYVGSETQRKSIGFLIKI